MPNLITFSHFVKFIYNFQKYKIVRKNELIFCLTIDGEGARLSTEYNCGFMILDVY